MASLSAERLGRIGGLLDRAVAAGLPGAVAFVARGDQVHVATAGLRELAAGRPMERNTLFRIASLGKPILAAATMILVEEARIALDDSVEPWLPELANRRVLRAAGSELDDTVPAIRPITLRDLLTFRFGLGAVMAPPGTWPIQAAMAELGVAPGPGQIPFGPDSYMERIGRLPLIHQPGERWLYHTGIDVLAVLLMRLTGEPLGAFLERVLFGPLGMSETGFHVPAGNLDRLAVAYAREEAGLAIWDEAAGGRYASPPAFPSLLVSSADDYLAFARMLLGKGRGPAGRILSRASVALMLSDQLTPEQKAASPFFPGFWDDHGWGFGGAITTRRSAISANPGSYGWSGGFGTHMVIDPAEDLFAMLWTQRLMTGADDTALSRDLFTLAYAAIDD